MNKSINRLKNLPKNNRYIKIKNKNKSVISVSVYFVNENVYKLAKLMFANTIPSRKDNPKSGNILTLQKIKSSRHSNQYRS